MYTSGTSQSTKKPRPTTSYLVRPRFGPLRGLYSARPATSTSDKKTKKKKPAIPKMDYRKKPDYADTAYREAVGRLRILLAESYTPIKRPLRDLDSAGEDTDNQSMISGNSRSSRLAPRPYYHYISTLPRRYYPTVKYSSSVLPADNTLSGTSKSDGAIPPELMSFIEKQEDYIEQLEKESRFCRDELGSLLSKVKDVISENENLHEKQKSCLMKSVFNHLETETETETELELGQKSLLSPRNRRSQVLEGPTIVFESRISELEAQLTQAKIDLKKAQEENEQNRKKLGDGHFLDGFSYDNYKSKLDNLQKEKDLLQDTVAKLQSALTKFRDKDYSTSDQVKRSLDVAEQAQYEKNAADLEIRRLKDELERQHSKLRDSIADQSRRVSDERSAIERRYTQQIEQLTAELGVQWESTNKLQLELDKQRRENGDLRRELAQKQALLDEMKKDMQNKIMTLQSDIGVTGAEKGALEQQIATLQMTNERNERQSKQEITRLQAEMQSLRQRLDRADADLIHSRRENIRLTEQVASLEKEININNALNDERKKKQDTSSTSEVLALPAPKKEQELSTLIQDMEVKHAATVAELEGMIHSQNQLMDKLSNECHTLTQKLDDASTRHKEEIRELQTSLDRLNNKFSQSQITSSSVKDEEYNPASFQRAAAPLQSPPRKPSPTDSRNLSRTNSRTSVKPPSLVPSRQNSQDKVTILTSSQPSPTSITTPTTTTTTPVITDTTTNNSVVVNSGGGSNNSNNNNQQYPANYQLAPDSDHQPQNFVDPNQQYDANQYDPQQYMTQEQYEQQYGVDPNLQQYTTDPNQQYTDDPNQQYQFDPNQQYTTNPDQSYQQENSEKYSTDPNLQYTDPQYQYQ